MSTEYIGIDFGEKSIGISYSVSGIALPYQSLAVYGSVKQRAQQLISFLTEQSKIPTIALIIGYPIGMRNNITKQTQSTISFVKHLQDILPELRIEKIDERLTSQESKHFQNTNSKKYKHRKNPNLDVISATLILKTFLDIHG